MICELARLRVASVRAEAVLITSSACGAPSNKAEHTNGQQSSVSSTLQVHSTPLIGAHYGLSWGLMACPKNSFVSSRATTSWCEPVYGLMVRSRRRLRWIPGVRQGCDLYPSLFNYAIDYILDRALQDYARVEVGENDRVFDLAYADDIVLVGSNCVDVQSSLNRVQAAAQSVGMTINASKTKFIPSLVDPVNWQPLTLDGVNLEHVQSFVYIGSIIMPSWRGAAEVDRRPVSFY